VAARYVVRNAGAPSALILGRPDVMTASWSSSTDDPSDLVPASCRMREDRDRGQRVGHERAGRQGRRANVRASAHGPGIRRRLPGAATVTSAPLDVDKLRVEIDGSGTIEETVAQALNECRIGVRRRVPRGDLSADSVEVERQGVGNVQVMAARAPLPRAYRCRNRAYRGDQG